MPMSPLGSGFSRRLKSPLKLDGLELRPAGYRSALVCGFVSDVTGPGAHLEFRELDLAQLRVALAVRIEDIPGEPVEDGIDDLAFALTLRLATPFFGGSCFVGMTHDRNNRLAATRTASHP